MSYTYRGEGGENNGGRTVSAKKEILRTHQKNFIPIGSLLRRVWNNRVILIFFLLLPKTTDISKRQREISVTSAEAYNYDLPSSNVLAS